MNFEKITYLFDFHGTLVDRLVLYWDQRPLFIGKPKLKKGAEGFLNELSLRNIRKGIVTNGRFNEIYPEYIETKLNRWFAVSDIIYRDMVENGKPDPDLYLKALERFNIGPTECVVFEDDEYGIMAAWEAGIRNIVTFESNKSYVPAVIKMIRDFSVISPDDVIK